MRMRLAASSEAAARAEQLSWLAGTGALILALLTGGVLRRSISEPLRRLAAGTREVARGRFGYRLDTQRGDEFAQVAEAFNTMTERLGALDHMKQDFVSTVSHDLKSPLASLRETTTLLIDEVPGSLTASQRRVLLLQRESADRLGRMIAKLLDLSRLHAGLALDRRPVELARLLQSAVEHARAAARERGIQVRLDAAPLARQRLVADEDRLRQLLDNLLENAIKFSPVCGAIDVAARVQRGIVVLEVADHGPGVPEPERKRIFERFHQTSHGRAVPGRGVGLGLTICREIVQAHGGSIRVESGHTGGSVFVTELPLGAVDDAADGDGAPPAGAGAVARDEAAA
jgi:two-component system sensor histidine kinase GlrK